MAIHSITSADVDRQPATKAAPALHTHGPQPVFAGADTVHFGRTTASSPLDLTPAQSRFLDDMNDLLAPYAGPAYVQGLDEAKRPPLEILNDLIRARQVITAVPVPPAKEAASLLKDPDFITAFSHAVPHEKLGAFEQFTHDDISPVVKAATADGHAKAQVLAAIELTRQTSIGVATFLGVNSGLAAEAISKIGTPEQSAFWLNAINQGLITSGFGLTEANVGSDPISMETTFEELPDGSFKLNGNKKFIGNAARVTDAEGNVVHPGADFLVIFAVDDSKKPPAERNFKAFMIPRTAIGEENIRHSGEGHNKMGLREVNNGDFDLKDVIVPRAFVLGNPDENIYDKLMGALDETRLMVGCMGLGTADAALEAATGYTSRRSQKGYTINRYQQVSFPLKVLLAKAEAARLLLLDTAEKVDKAATHRERGEKPLVFKTETAMSKLYGTELGFEAAHQGIRALGGRGFIENPAEGLGLPKRARDVEVTRIYEGTNELQHNLIAQGVMITEGKQLPKFPPLALAVMLGRQRKAMAVLAKPVANRVGPRAVLEAAYDYATIHAMMRFNTEKKKPWDASAYEGWDKGSLLRQQMFDASLPVQQRLAVMADIATLRHLANLSADEIARIDDKKAPSGAEKLRKQQLELFIKVAAQEAVEHVNTLRGQVLEQLEADYKNR